MTNDTVAVRIKRAGARLTSWFIANCAKSHATAVAFLSAALTAVGVDEYAIALVFALLCSSAEAIYFWKVKGQRGTAIGLGLSIFACSVVWVQNRKHDHPWSNILPSDDISIEWNPPQGMQNEQFVRSNFALLSGKTLFAIDNALSLDMTNVGSAQEIRSLAIEIRCKWPSPWIKLTIIDPGVGTVVLVQGPHGIMGPQNTLEALKFLAPDLLTTLAKQPGLDPKHSVSGWIFLENPVTLSCQKDVYDLRARIGDGRGNEEVVPIKLPNGKVHDPVSQFVGFAVGGHVDISGARWERWPSVK